MAFCILDKEKFVELWRRLLPAAYTQPIESEQGGVGMDAVYQAAAQWDAVERAQNAAQQSYFILDHSARTGPIATSGTKATGEVQITRVAPALGDVVIPVGRRLYAEATDSYGQRLFLGRVVVTEETTIPAGTGGPVALPVAAEFPGFEGNYPSNVVTRFEPQGLLAVPASIVTTTQLWMADAAGDRFNAGLAGRYATVVGTLATPDGAVPRRIVATYVVGAAIGIEVEPAFDAADLGQPVIVELLEAEELGLRVSQPDAIEGGTWDALGVVAAERALSKIGGESDSQYRERVAELPDVVTPNAIRRIIARHLDPHGIPWCMEESADPEGLIGFTWDMHAYDVGEVCACSIVRPTGSELLGSGAIWLSLEQHYRFFQVCVGRRTLGDPGDAWDEFPWDVAAWYDSTESAFNAVIASLWVDLYKARAGGVGFVILVDPLL